MPVFNEPPFMAFGGIRLSDGDATQTFTSTASKATPWSSASKAHMRGNFTTTYTDGDQSVNPVAGSDKIMLKPGGTYMVWCHLGLGQVSLVDAAKYQFHLRLDGAEMSPDLGTEIAAGGATMMVQIQGVIQVPFNNQADNDFVALELYGEQDSGASAALEFGTAQLTAVRVR
jgi:hypothetical protein